MTGWEIAGLVGALALTLLVALAATIIVLNVRYTDGTTETRYV